jgi:antitoxin StbD
MEPNMNQIFQRVEADLVTTITDLKKNPNAVFEAAESQAVAVLNHNRVVGYVISPVAWEGILERLDDLHIIEMLEKHKDEPTIPVTLDELSGPIRRKRPEKLEQTRLDRSGAVREGVASTGGKSSRARRKAPR